MQRCSTQHQRGVVLIVSLIVLVLVTLIGIAGVRGGVLEIHASSNEEERVLAFQTTQAAVDEIDEDSDHFIVTGEVNQVIKCSTNASCTNHTLAFTSSALGSANQAAIRRLAPKDATPGRMPHHEFSADKFRSTFFQAESEHNATGAAHGRARVVQGYMKLIPNMQSTDD